MASMRAGRARSGSISSKRPAAMSSRGALVDERGGAGEVGEILEGLSPRAATCLHCLPADALDRRERVADRALVDVEDHARAVDGGRFDDDAETLRLTAEFRELVGVVEIERHQRGEELDRVVRLHVGGLVRDQRISRRVRLVEAVIGEFREQVEYLVGERLGQAVGDGALHETVALGVHLGLDLLAHGAAQQVRVAERVAGELLGRLHHLFLVHDDAEGLAQDRLELRMQVPARLVGFVLAELARAIDGDVGHRGPAVERHEGDDVLEAVRLHLDERLAHARRFHLEDAHRLAAAEIS
jgi:hypothetical protein